MTQLKLLVIVVDRSGVDKVCDSIKARGAAFAHVCYGKGTAQNDWLNLLGLGETEKGVIFATATPDVVPDVMEVLIAQHHFDKPGMGICFTVPLTSVGGPASLRILEG